MKKLVFLFIFISSLCLGAWENIELVDDFKEKTGNVSSYCHFINGFIRLDKHSDGRLYLTINPGNYITASNITKVKLKVDDGIVYVKDALVSKDGEEVFVFINDEIINDFKNGNILKIVITKYNDNTIFKQIPLTNFSNTFNKVR